MTTYYVNESDTPRECTCACGAIDGAHHPQCTCRGSGKLGNPEAPRFEVWQSTFEPYAGLWFWQRQHGLREEHKHTGFASEPLAIEAARKALGGRSSADVSEAIASGLNTQASR